MQLALDTRKALIFFPALALLLSSCSSFDRQAVSASNHAEMDCVELNRRIAANSAEISRAAITRGEVARRGIPAWLIGGQRVTDAVVDRRTAQIERLQEEQRTLIAARSARCAA